jgi:hypothetical protein
MTHAIKHKLASGRLGFAPLGLFLGAVIVAEVWVLWPPLRPEEPLYLRPRTTLAGYRFETVPLNVNISVILGTTNILNGHFFDTQSNRVSVFQAEWAPGQGTGANVFGHTPEICWVGSGFRTVQQDQPDELAMPFAGMWIPFQCRVMQHPALSLPEITVWAVCWDGRWDCLQFYPPYQTEECVLPPPALKQFGRILKNRLEVIRRLSYIRPAHNGRKQFIRLSKPIMTDSKTALQELEQFAAVWLPTSGPSEATIDNTDGSSQRFLKHSD